MVIDYRVVVERTWAGKIEPVKVQRHYKVPMKHRATIMARGFTITRCGKLIYLYIGDLDKFREYEPIEYVNTRAKEFVLGKYLRSWKLENVLNFKQSDDVSI
jgi:hypothetical protein